MAVDCLEFLNAFGITSHKLRGESSGGTGTLYLRNKGHFYVTDLASYKYKRLMIILRKI